MPNIFTDAQVSDLEAFGLTVVKNNGREAIVDLPAEPRHRITRKDASFILEVDACTFELADMQAVLDEFYSLYLAMQAQD